MGIRIRTTEHQKKYWKNRKINWKQAYLSTWNHSHRALIIHALKMFQWVSLWEVGCGPGANLVRIVKDLPGHQLGGSDINEDAIELAKKTLTEARFHVESVENMLLSSASVDVILSDACLIYIGPTRIKKALHEMVRSSRSYVVLCEFHSESFWKRWMYRITQGYHVHDYQKLLEDEGCFDIQKIKIPKAYWNSDGWNKFGHIIIAKVLHKI